MPEEIPSLHIDTDWKKKAQEEKRKLAEEQKAKAAAAAPPPAVPSPMPGAPAASPGGRGMREIPTATFASLVQTIVTQALFYMGDLAPRGSEPQVNLDMAKLQIDLLGILEDKTRNNLTPDEQKMMDAALYETRMRFVGISSQVINQ